MGGPGGSFCLKPGSIGARAGPGTGGESGSLGLGSGGSSGSGVILSLLSITSSGVSSNIMGGFAEENQKGSVVGTAGSGMSCSGSGSSKDRC